MNATIGAAVAATALALGGAAVWTGTADAQTARICDGVAVGDMASAGIVSEAADSVFAYACDGSGDAKEVSGDSVKGLPLLDMGDGRYFAPKLGAWLDTLDVTASESRQVTTGCENAAEYGSAKAATSMGHGACK